MASLQAPLAVGLRLTVGIAALALASACSSNPGGSLQTDAGTESDAGSQQTDAGSDAGSDAGTTDGGTGDGGHDAGHDFIAGAEVEPNGGATPEQVNWVLSPADLTGAIDPVDDLDIFAVDLTAGERWTWNLASEGSSFSPHLIVYDASNDAPKSFAGARQAKMQSSNNSFSSRADTTSSFATRATCPAVEQPTSETPPTRGASL